MHHYLLSCTCEWLSESNSSLFQFQCCMCTNLRVYVCSYYLYTYDKMVAPNVSLRKEAEVSHEVLGALLKQHYSRRALTHDSQPTTGQYTHTT